MPYLQQLELIVTSGGSINLLDGNQWESFIQKHLFFLSKFDFKFKITNIDRNSHDEKNFLTPFRSSFWLKRNPAWYVVYNVIDCILYTVPRFVPDTIKYSLLSSFTHLTTLPDDKYFIYYNKIHEIDIDLISNSSYKCTNVQRLILSIKEINNNTLDFSKVTYLCVTSISWSIKKLLKLIKTTMTCLYHLKIDFKFLNTQFSDVDSMEQIRILELPQFSYSLKNDNNDLSSIFPFIERLIIKISGIFDMSHIIDRFIYLSSVSFNIINTNDGSENLFTNIDICKWLIENTERLQLNSNFTYRLESHPDIWIHLWISTECISSEKVSYF